MNNDELIRPLIRINTEVVDVKTSALSEPNIAIDMIERKQVGYSNNNKLPAKGPIERKIERNNRQPNFDRNIQKGKQRPKFNYFTQQIQQNGERFIDKLRPFDLANNAERIIRELAKGKIDIAVHGIYIANPVIITALSVFSVEQYNRCEVIRNALQITCNVAASQGIIPDPLTIKLLEEHKCKAQIYSICMNRFYQVQTTGDVDYLIPLTRELGPYSYNI